MKRLSRGFTLVEVLTTVAVLGLLLLILLPSLSRARESARTAGCAMQLRGFGSAFEIYASEDRAEKLCSGAFDHLRDGDIRRWGWVRDAIELAVGNPGQMLCPSNPVRLSQTVADYTGAASIAPSNPNRVHPQPVVGVGSDSAAVWADGYNTNYTATWLLVRGDPTADDGYGNNGDASDPAKCPRDGDGPLDRVHLEGVISTGRLPLLGDGRIALDTPNCLTGAMASDINAFAGKNVASTGQFMTDSFTDGMTVDYSAVADSPGAMGHDFSDIAPLHHTRSYVGGVANVLFADGHVDGITDGGGRDGEPDGFIGPYRVDGGVEINDSAFAEVDGQLHWTRIRPSWR